MFMNNPSRGIPNCVNKIYLELSGNVSCTKFYIHILDIEKM